MLLTVITMIDKFFKYYEKLDIVINNNITSNKVAVIIEPRNHKYLVGVIKQTMDKLGDTWNLRIFGSDKNEANIKENIKGTYTFVNMRIDDFVSPDAYSLFMQSKQFWNKIAEQHILIFQTDSFVLSNNYSIPLKYGFIGAPYFYGYNIHSDDRIDINAPVKGGYNINGGFSYRNKNVMLDCINKVENADIINYRKTNGLNIDYFIDRVIIPEDVFFVNAMTVLNYPMPVREMPQHTECAEFCLNQYQENSINENNELIEKWINKIDSLTLYNMYIINSDQTKQFAESFPKDETEDITGVNFISLLKHEEFYLLYNKIDKDKLKFYTKYFNEYMFKGKNLYSFWANKNNPMFLLTFAIGNGLNSQDYIKAKQETIQGMQHVTSV